MVGDGGEMSSSCEVQQVPKTVLNSSPIQTPPGAPAIKKVEENQENQGVVFNKQQPFYSQQNYHNNNNGQVFHNRNFKGYSRRQYHHNNNQDYPNYQNTHHHHHYNHYNHYNPRFNHQNTGRNHSNSQGSVQNGVGMNSASSGSVQQPLSAAEIDENLNLYITMLKQKQAASQIVSPSTWNSMDDSIGILTLNNKPYQPPPTLPSVPASPSSSSNPSPSPTTKSGVPKSVTTTSSSSKSSSSSSSSSSQSNSGSLKPPTTIPYISNGFPQQQQQQQLILNGLYRPASNYDLYNGHPRRGGSNKGYYFNYFGPPPSSPTPGGFNPSLPPPPPSQQQQQPTPPTITLSSGGGGGGGASNNAKNNGISMQNEEKGPKSPSLEKNVGGNNISSFMVGEWAANGAPGAPGEEVSYYVEPDSDFNCYSGGTLRCSSPGGSSISSQSSINMNNPKKSRYHSGESNSSELSIGGGGGGGGGGGLQVQQTNPIHQSQANAIILDLKSQAFRLHTHQYRIRSNFPTIWNLKIDPGELVKDFTAIEMKERPGGWELSKDDEFYELSEDIWNMFLDNQQTLETFRNKMELWRDVYEVLKTNVHHSYSKYGLQVVGSTMSGFGSNSSDVDMCLLIRRTEVDQRYEAVDRLHSLLSTFRSTPFVKDPEIIYAKVPILKFHDSNRNLDVDLNCNNYVGVRNTHLLYAYSQLDWRVKPLVLIVKLWAATQGINDAKLMTISSYSLVLMVIHFLQSPSVQVLPCLHQMYPEKFSPHIDVLKIKINEIFPPWNSQNRGSLGELLLHFLEYFALKFDFSRQAVSIRLGSTISIKQCMSNKNYKNDPHQWKYICIEEPFDFTNTARSVYDKSAFDKIRGIFYISWQYLSSTRRLHSIFNKISEDEARMTSDRLFPAHIPPSFLLN